MCAAGLRLYGVEDVRKLLDCYLEILKRYFGGRLVSVAVFGSLARVRLPLRVILTCWWLWRAYLLMLALG